MDSFVDDVCAHDGPGALGCVDADQQEMMLFCPCDMLVGKQARMAEFDCEFLCSCFFDELLKNREIGEGWWQLDEVVMDAVFQGGEECFEPLEAFNSFRAEFLEMGDGPVDLDDPGEVSSFDCPGFDHVWIGELVEAHVQLNRV